MTANYEHPDDEFQRLHAIVTAGTEDLWQAAVASAGFLIRDADTAVAFISECNELEAYSQAHEGQLPEGVFPPTSAAVLAINALKAARTQNIIADPGLNATYKNDRRAAANSLFVIAASVEVAEAALAKLNSEK